MIRHLKSIRRDTLEVVEVIGLVLMVAIVISTAVVLHISMTETNNSKLNKIPMVNIQQINKELVIISIQHGPVLRDEITINILDNAGSHLCNGDLPSAGPYLSSGDKIAMPCVESGKTYKIQMVYLGNMIGIAEYDT